MHVIVETVKAAAGLPAEQVATAECLCGWVCVVAEADHRDLDEAVADHLTFHGAN